MTTLNRRVRGTRDPAGQESFSRQTEAYRLRGMGKEDRDCGVPLLLTLGC